MSAFPLGVGVARSAAAGCVGPEINMGEEVQNAPRTGDEIALTRGQLVTVSGTRFRHGCSDVGIGGGGCGAAPRQGPDPGSPLTDVELTLQQGQRSWVLGTEGASAQSAGFTIRWDVQIPSDAGLGPAELRADTASMPIRIRA